VDGNILSLSQTHLIREMSVANPLWGAPRIHGELLKLGIDVGQTCVYRKPKRERSGDEVRPGRRVK
jgi:hypothetical protein